ncbi:hypothetical protein Sjap_020762 [Stephania japonica]|uniref:Transmembrane protein n=1 Tax=Stephania japonica TaxID=461633 RepID=A0AAP0F8M7_9MAGN
MVGEDQKRWMFLFFRLEDFDFEKNHMVLAEDERERFWWRVAMTKCVLVLCVVGCVGSYSHGRFILNFRIYRLRQMSRRARRTSLVHLMRVFV